MKRQFGTLLAVTLAAAPAAASPHRGAAPPPTPTRAPAPATAPAPTPPPTTRPAGPPAPSFMQQLVNAFAIAQRTAARPRELRCGAPACGNVTSRLAPGSR